MKIEVLGTGCSKCNDLENKVKQAIAKKGGFVQIEKVSDLQKIMAYGVMSTPGVVVDGKVVHAGGLPGPDQARAWVRD